MYSYEKLLELIENGLRGIELPKEPANLYDPINYSLSDGGKRVRPIAVLMAYNLFKDQVEPCLDAALALEVFHNFTLLHDDIMDNASVRRGKPTVHKKWCDSVAILSGDAMLIYAYKLLAGLPSEKLRTVIQSFNQVAIEVCEGQQYDMDFESQKQVTVAQYLKMIELKTAVLLAGGMRIGAICADASSLQAQQLYDFGINIGLAFQLQDDLMDTYADPSTFGKNIGGDIVSGKKTFLLTSTLEMADAVNKELLLSLLDNKNMTSSQKIQQVKHIYDHFSIRDITNRAIASYFDRALEILDGLDLPLDRKMPLRELAYTLLNRKK